MNEMNELWGIMNVLDSADDVALFIVGAREGKVLYCNHLVAVRTNAHPGSPLEKVWDKEDYQKAVAHCNEGGTYRYIVEKSVFGNRRNVTVNKVVWSRGMLAYSFLITAHADDEEEEERDRVFHLIGQSYEHILLINFRKGEVKTLLNDGSAGGGGHQRAVYYHPISYDEWRRELIQNHAHPDDAMNMMDSLAPEHVLETMMKQGTYAFQYRKRTNNNYRWYEMRFRQLPGMGGSYACTERDVDGEKALDEKERANEVILRSIANVFRSIYLLDLKTATYTTVKPDLMLFGIPEEGDYEQLSGIVAEFITEEGHRKDYLASFSIDSLMDAFDQENVENIAREYCSNVQEGKGWISITAFRPPYMQGMEGKCVLTFMDETEHKRLEAERNERNLIINILSARYVAIFFLNLQEDTFYSIKLPQEFRYIEKQYRSIFDAMQQYAKAYVLEDYREDFINRLRLENLRKQVVDGIKREYIYKSVSGQTVRLHIIPVSADGQEGNDPDYREAVLVFEYIKDIVRTGDKEGTEDA